MKLIHEKNQRPTISRLKLSSKLRLYCTNKIAHYKNYYLIIDLVYIVDLAWMVYQAWMVQLACMVDQACMVDPA